MRKIMFVINFIVIGAACLFVFLVFTLDRNPYSKEERVANLVLNRIDKSIMSQYDFIPFGSGITMPGGPIRAFFLAYRTKHFLTKEELRRHLISMSEIMVKEVNNNEEIQKILYNDSFNIKNVDILIYNYNQEERVFEPGVDTARIAKGILDYKFMKEDLSSYYLEKETYQEAIKAISEESN